MPNPGANSTDAVHALTDQGDNETMSRRQTRLIDAALLLSLFSVLPDIYQVLSFGMHWVMAWVSSHPIAGLFASCYVAAVLVKIYLDWQLVFLGLKTIKRYGNFKPDPIRDSFVLVFTSILLLAPTFLLLFPIMIRERRGFWQSGSRRKLFRSVREEMKTSGFLKARKRLNHLL